jgi:hypothetical protein
MATAVTTAFRRSGAVSINDALVRPKAKTTKGQEGKGNSNKNQSLENVLLWMYTENNGRAFTAMGQIDNCKLHEQRTDVWQIFLAEMNTFGFSWRNALS